MYYPYLRGKQFELLTLREFSADYRNCECIVPIIEPVKLAFNGMRTAVQTMMDNGMRFAVVLNPHEGDLARVDKDVLAEIPLLRERLGCWIPAFIYNNQSVQTIRNTDLTDIMIIFKDNVDFANPEIEQLVAQNKVTYVVNSQSDNRFAKRMFNRIGKQVIRLDEQFVPLARNIDYVDSVDEPFTSEYLYYQEDGFAGFSDYMLLPKTFIEGGSLPVAVVIHLTYERSEPDAQVMMMHCCSESNYDNKNVQQKFFEAAREAIRRMEGKYSGAAMEELRSCINQQSPRYPGLGVVKKISMKHHLELMNHILSR